MLDGKTNDFSCLEVVRGHDDVDVIDRAEHRQVVKRVMGRSQRPVADAGTDPDQLHRVVAVADVVLDLFERPRGEKTGRGNREDDLAA